MYLKKRIRYCLKLVWACSVTVLFVNFYQSSSSSESEALDQSSQEWIADETITQSPEHQHTKGPPNQTKQHINAFQSNIFYLKLHKTGSTTINSILYRFAAKHDLRVALYCSKWGQPYPHKALPQLLYEIIPDSYLNNTNTSFVDKTGEPERTSGRPVADASVANGGVPAWQPYNIMADHALYDEHWPLGYMAPDTVLVTSIREPFSRMLSAFKYFMLTDKFGLGGEADPVATFLLGNDSRKADWLRDGHMVWLRDSQARLLGYNAKRDNGATFSEQLATRLQFVIVLERFDESLVLMRRRFGWQITDILYASLNTKPRGEKFMPSVTRSPETIQRMREAYREMSPVDHAIYEYFLDHLNKQIKMEGAGFDEEVLLFRQLLNNVTEFCRDSCLSLQQLRKEDTSKDSLLWQLRQSLLIPATEFWPDATVTLAHCRLLTTGTLHWQKASRIRQFGHSEACGGEGRLLRQPVQVESQLDATWCQGDRLMYGFPLQHFSSCKFS